MAETDNKAASPAGMVGIGLNGFPAWAGSESTEPARGEKPVSDFKIPPALWIIVFLVLGYVGMRFLIAD